MTGVTLRFTIALLILNLPLTGAAAEVVMLESPASPSSSLGRLSADDSGRLLLSWVTSGENVDSLYFARLHGDKFSPPERIASGSDWFVNWADFPYVQGTGNSVTAHWLRKRDEGTYNYDVVAAFRNPDTNTWSEGEVIHQDGVSAEHGFVGMLPMPGEQTLISWLDGRHSASHGHASEGGHGQGGMTLRAGVFGPDGRPINDWELDRLVCDCCQTSVAMSSEGPIVVYRDRSPAEIRDIYITRMVDGTWFDPAPVFEDNWEIAGCPVNGPSVAARDDHVAVGWFSAKNNEPTVSLSLSSDGGASFPRRVIVAEGKTNGRVSVTLLESGNIALSWLQTEGKSAWVKLGLYTISGEKLDGATVAETVSSRQSGFPVIASRGNDVFVTWTEVGDEKQVRVARVRF